MYSLHKLLLKEPEKILEDVLKAEKILNCCIEIRDKLEKMLENFKSYAGRLDEILDVFEDCYGALNGYYAYGMEEQDWRKILKEESLWRGKGVKDFVVELEEMQIFKKAKKDGVRDEINYLKNKLGNLKNNFKSYLNN